MSPPRLTHTTPAQVRFALQHALAEEKRATDRLERYCAGRIAALLRGEAEHAARMARPDRSRFAAPRGAAR